MRVAVTYVFGLAKAASGPEATALELPAGATVFQAMQRLGVSCLEVHAAVNGESAPDGRVLLEGDRLMLIPAIQGGSTWAGAPGRLRPPSPRWVGRGVGGWREGPT